MVVESLLMNAAATCNEFALKSLDICMGYCNEQVEFERKNFQEQAENAMIDLFNQLDSSTNSTTNCGSGSSTKTTTTTKASVIEECQNMLFDEESVCSRITQSDESSIS